MDIIEHTVEGNIVALLTYLAGGGDPNYSEDAAGVTLLHHAVTTENVAVIAVLLVWGADPLRCDRILQQSPFSLAMRFPLSLVTLQMLTQIPYRLH